MVFDFYFDGVTVKTGNKSALDNNDFVTEALNDLLATQCISVVESQPWVVNPLTVSTRDDGKRRLVLDLRHVNPHLFKYKFKCETIFGILIIIKNWIIV